MKNTEEKLPIKYYTYFTHKNKFKEKGKSPNILKRNLIQKKGKICYKCKKEFDNIIYLQLEHIIPIKIGGHLFDDKNIDLICTKCHREKTRTDIMTINILKKIGIITGKWQISSFYKIDEIQNFFKQFNSIIKDIDMKNKIYYLGKDRKDYIQIQQNSNRISNGK
jgi:hypothetical protein